MKTGRIFWGLGFILLAVVFLLDALGVTVPLADTFGEISLFSAILGFLLLSCAISQLLKRKFGEAFIPLAIVFMIFEKNIAALCGREDPNIINNGILIGCAVLLCIGFSILFPENGARITVNPPSHIHGYYGNNLSSRVEYIDSSDFVTMHTENNLGSLSIHFANADQYKGGGTLYVENNLGHTEINVPSSWRFEHKIDNSLGHVTVQHLPDNPNGPLLIIKGENDLGKISIKRV